MDEGGMCWSEEVQRTCTFDLEDHDDDFLSEDAFRSSMVNSTTTMTGPAIRSTWAVQEDFVREVTQRSLESYEDILASETERVVSQLQGAQHWGRPAQEIVDGSTRSTMFPSFISDVNLQYYYLRGRMCSCRLPLHPDTTKRFIWDLACCAFMMFDAVMVPLVLMVLAENSYPRVLDLVIALFWSCDIVLTFLTAVYIQSELKTSFRVIARHYATTWLVLDLLMVLPEFAFLLIPGNRRSPMTFLRPLKVIRGLRLLRVVKIEALLREQLKRINSVSAMMSVNLLQLVFIFLMLNHVIACGWFAIGKAKGNGWFQAEIVSKDVDSNLMATYLIALHWSITQFHGSMDVGAGNPDERLFAIIVLVAGMLTSSVLVSVTTNMIFQVRQAHWKHHDQSQRLRAYFLRHDIPSTLMLAAKRYVQHSTCGRKEWIDETALLQPLPALLRKIVLMEARSPIVEHHCLFAWLKLTHHIVFRDLCHSAFEVMHVPAGHTVFFYGDACQHMFFVDSGTSRYLKNQRDSMTGREWVGPESLIVRQVSVMPVGTRIDRKCWICEPALWAKGWQNKGSMLAVSDCVFLCADTNQLAAVVCRFPSVHLDVVLYVRWAINLMSLAADVTDLWRVDVESD